MSKQSQHDESRRNFLKTGSVAVAAGCFTVVGLKAALKEARAAGKPVLTEANINAHIPPPTSPAFKQFVDSVKGGLHGHLDRNFYLTPEQRKEIQSMSQMDINKITEALDRAVKEKKKVRVQIIGGRRMMSEATPSGMEGFVPVGAPPVLLPKVDIHFGDDGFSIKVSK